ncbi:MAG: hypothetical protein ACU0CO_00535 [Shimia sp.]
MDLGSSLLADAAVAGSDGCGWRSWFVRGMIAVGTVAGALLGHALGAALWAILGGLIGAPVGWALGMIAQGLAILVAIVVPLGLVGLIWGWATGAF